MANRMESTPGTEGAAAAAAAPATKPAPGGFKAWLPLIVTLLIMPALAYAMTTFVLLPKLQKGLGLTPAATTATERKGGKSGSEASEKREAVTMAKLLVNVAGTMGARYLLVSLNVVSTDADFAAKMKEHDPQLRDMAMGTLRVKTLADLEKPGAVNLIRTELITGFNNILGGALVKEIYVTEFAIQ
jgi:flagellar protein FliL